MDWPAMQAEVAQQGVAVYSKYIKFSIESRTVSEGQKTMQFLLSPPALKAVSLSPISKPSAKT